VHVADDPDDRPLNAAVQLEPQHAADGGLPGPQRLRQAIADDNADGTRGAIVLVEGVARDPSNPERVEQRRIRVSDVGDDVRRCSIAHPHGVTRARRHARR
jgi:hypothetical protein